MNRALATPEAVDWSINKILTEAQSGRLQVPEFQRNFRWGAADVLNLFDSLYRGYPIGNLLIWETTPPPAARASFGSLRFDPAPGDALLVIDGQQRITCLVASLLAGADEADRRFRVFFDLESEKFCHQSGHEQPNRTWLPMTEVADTIRFLEWLQNAQLSPDLVRRANEVVRALRDYRVPAYKVIGGAEQEGQIREIFRRLNTMGKSLSESEIFKALHGGGENEGLGSIAEALKSARFGELDERWLLKAVAGTLGLTRDKAVTSHFSAATSEGRRAALANAERGLRRTIDFLRRDACVPHWSLLPYRFPIIAMAAFFTRFEEVDQASRDILRVWLWEGARGGQHARIDEPTVRAALRGVSEAKSPVKASRALLDMLTTEPAETDVGVRAHNSRTASTKIVGCVLANQGPRNLETGETLNLLALLASKNPYQQLVVRPNTGTEARVLHPALRRGTEANAQALVALLRGVSDQGVLASHLIDADSAEALIQGREDAFLQRRENLLAGAVRDFLTRMCSQADHAPDSP